MDVPDCKLERKKEAEKNRNLQFQLLSIFLNLEESLAPRKHFLKQNAADSYKLSSTQKNV